MLFLDHYFLKNEIKEKHMSGSEPIRKWSPHCIMILYMYTCSLLMHHVNMGDNITENRFQLWHDWLSTSIHLFIYIHIIMNTLYSRLSDKLFLKESEWPGTYNIHYRYLKQKKIKLFFYMSHISCRLLNDLKSRTRKDFIEKIYCKTKFCGNGLHIKTQYN